jgi:formate dehydrogenase maturation protein FdhE
MLEDLTAEQLSTMLNFVADIAEWYKVFISQSMQLQREKAYLSRLERPNFGISEAWRDGQRRYHQQLYDGVQERRQQTLEAIVHDVEDLYHLLHDTPSTAYSA